MRVHFESFLFCTPFCPTPDLTNCFLTEAPLSAFLHFRITMLAPWPGVLIDYLGEPWGRKEPTSTDLNLYVLPRWGLLILKLKKIFFCF